MDVLRVLTRVVLVVASLVIALPVHAGVPNVPGASTAATLDELYSGLYAAMEQGEQTGDYMLAKAAVKTRHAIDVWRTGNREVLDRPFEELDPVVRETFGRTRTLLNEASDETRYRPEIAQQLAENASQIVDTRPGPARQSYILGYMPRIVSPHDTGTFTLHVRGINLDQADPVLYLPGGTAERVLNSPYEAQFTVPLSAIPSHPTKLQVHTLIVTYTTSGKGFMARLLGRREFVTRQLSIVRLPSSVATFELSGTRMSDRRSEMTFTAEPVQFRGTREQVYKVVSPPPVSRDGQGSWRWDLSKDLRLVQSRGMQGRCEGIDMNRSSETGITVVARVEGEVKSRKKRKGAPGWVDCTVVGTVYRVEHASVPMEKQTVTLTWSKDESLEVPGDANVAELIATTFDGRMRRFSESDEDKFFEVRREAQRFVIVPRVPEDILLGD